MIRYCIQEVHNRMTDEAEKGGTEMTMKQDEVAKADRYGCAGIGRVGTRRRACGMTGRRDGLRGCGVRD